MHAPSLFSSRRSFLFVSGSRALAARARRSRANSSGFISSASSGISGSPLRADPWRRFALRVAVRPSQKLLEILVQAFGGRTQRGFDRHIVFDPLGKLLCRVGEVVELLLAPLVEFDSGELEIGHG